MSERPLIVCTDDECRFEDEDLARLRTVGDVRTCESYQVEIVAGQLPRAEVLVASCFSRVPEELLAAGPQLKAVVKYGVGIDNIDIPAATRRGIMVCNCPDYGSGTVAEQAVAMLLALARQIVPVDIAMREQGWMWPADRWIGVDVESKTVGILGLGRIGREFARRMRGFGVRLLACDPQADDAALAEFGCESVNFDTLLAESDFLSLHCVLTERTRQIIDAAALAKMKPSAFIINVSRGALIDEPDLIEALQAGRLAGAGLDVFAAEPLTKDHPLLALPQVVVAPHFAWYTKEAAARESAQAADAVLDVLAGRPPRSVINQQELAG